MIEKVYIIALKMIKYIYNDVYNTLVTVIISVLCFFLFLQSSVLNDLGMVAMVLKWLPVAIGVVTLMAYLFTRLCNVNWGWKMTVLGAVINILLVLTAYFGN